MDKNQIIALADLHPTVRIANWHAMRAGMEWGPRRSLDCQLLLVVSGALSYRPVAETVTSRVAPGEVLFIPGGERHYLSCPVAGVLSTFHAEFANGYWADGSYRLDPAPARVTACDDVVGLQQRFRQAADLFAGHGRYREERLRATVAEIIWMLGERWNGAVLPGPGGRVQDMVAFIRERLPAPTDRQDLARAFGLSAPYINELFKAELGATPTAVVQRERCLVALKALQQGAPVHVAAQQAGFDDPFYFSRVFKKCFGMAPRRARLGSGRAR